MIASMLPYVWHRPDCEYRKGGDVDCTCGFREMLAFTESTTTRYGELPKMRPFGKAQGDSDPGQAEPPQPGPQRVDPLVLPKVLEGQERTSHSDERPALKASRDLLLVQGRGGHHRGPGSTGSRAV